MVLFLTSSPCGTYDRIEDREIWEMSREYDFSEKLRNYCPEHSRWLMIAADPEEYDRNDQMVEDFFRMMTISGVSLERMDLCDGRNGASITENLDQYDGIILGGGHVPTQKSFFDEIHLKEKIAGFKGIVIGISAGTMNCADVVYSTPELEGEAVDPEYLRFPEGLGLTELQVIPHIQKSRFDVIDGLRLVEDIVVPDSVGNVFYALPDGSYILQEKDKEVLYGEALRIADEKITEMKAEEGMLLSCRIRESAFNNRKEMHEYLKEQLGLPDYYGKNLDALYDCLTEMDYLVIYYEKKEGEGPYGLRETMEDAADANPGLILKMEDCDE